MADTGVLTLLGTLGVVGFAAGDFHWDLDREGEGDLASHEGRGETGTYVFDMHIGDLACVVLLCENDSSKELL